MSGARYDVTTLGEPLLALVAERPADLERARFGAHVTGAEVNVAVGLARLGHAVTFVGVLGDDAPAGLVERRLRGEGVDLRHTRRTAGDTGTLIRELRAFGPADVLYRRAGSAGATLGPDDVHAARAVIQDSRWVHLTGVTPALSASCRDATAQALALARAAGVPASLDINYRGKLWSRAQARHALAPLAEAATIVFGDDDELELLTGYAGPADAVRRLRQHGVEQVVRKRGAAGAESAHTGGVDRVAAHAATVVDPVGAGDAFAAGYISALLDGGEPSAALERGAICGAYAVSAIGDTAALPDRRRLALHTGNPQEALR